MRKFINKFISVVICLFILGGLLPAGMQTVKADELKVLAFPGAEGAGKYTTGGRGGEVYEVTTLDDYNPLTEQPVKGSIRDALSSSNRIIVFKVGGTIHLKSTLNIVGNNLTIAGQTAPGDGICLADYEIVFADSAARTEDKIMNPEINTSGNNIIMRYIRVRVGDKNPSEADAIWARGKHDIIIDHCSFSWSSDETCSIYNCVNTTVQWCVISESMTMSGHEKGRHGYGAIFGGADATAHHNLIVSHTSRAPRIDGMNQLGRTATEFANNVIYNWGFNSLYGGQSDSKVDSTAKTNTNLINNYYKQGPGTINDPNGATTPSANVFFRIADPSKPVGNWYINGNYMEGYPEVTADNWKGVYLEDPANTVALTAPATVKNSMTSYETAQEAYNSVLEKAGVTLPRRDSLDQRVINDVKNGTGRFVNTTKEAGGYPEYNNDNALIDSDHDGMPDSWETANRLNPQDASDANIICADGYTNIEKYINSIVNEYEKKPHTNPDISLKSPTVNQLLPAEADTVIEAENVRANNRGTISKVEFYANDVKLGEVTKPPYKFTWQKPAQGTYYISAKAFDNEGWSTQSNVVPVHVNEPDNVEPEWTSADIGSVPIEGTAYFDGRAYTVKGSGVVNKAIDPTNTTNGYNDNFHYVYKKISGDADLVARMDNFTYVDNEAMSGLMIRKDLTAGSPMAYVSIQCEKADLGTGETGKAIVFSARDKQNGELLVNPAPPTNASKYHLGYYPKGLKMYWLRLKRIGSDIEALYSVDGYTWVSLYKQTLDLGSDAYIGMSVDAAKNLSQINNYNTVKYSNVNLNTGFLSVDNLSSQEVQDDNYVIAGSISSAANVTIVNNGAEVFNSDLASDAKFSKPIQLTGGLNNITVAARDSSGNSISRDIKVTYIQPVLTITKTLPYYADGSVSSYTVSGTATSDITISLTANENQLITNKALQAGESFSQEIVIADGDNEVVLTAVNSSGEATEFNYNCVKLTKIDYMVDAGYQGQDGAQLNGIPTYKTVQAAIDAAPVPTSEKERKLIFVKNGIYKEKIRIRKPYISLFGENKDNTVITFDDHVDESRSSDLNNEHPTERILANDFTAENITFEATAGQIERANAIYTEGNRLIFKNCNIFGGQDTVYLNKTGSKLYFEKCKITGDVDFIYGASTAVFYDCDIVSVVHTGYLTAPATDQTTPYGFIFINSRILSRDVGPMTTMFSRTWHNYPSTAFVNCYIGFHIRPVAWSDWGSTANQTVARYYEYGSYGPGADPAGRVSWSKQLTDEEAAAYTVDNILSGSDNWKPENFIKSMHTLSLNTFKVENLSVKDISGNNAGSLDGSFDIAVAADIFNNLPDKSSGLVIIELIDKQGEILNTTYSTINVLSLGSDTAGAQFSSPDLSSGYKIKVYVVDNLQNRKLISNVLYK